MQSNRSFPVYVITVSHFKHRQARIERQLGELGLAFEYILDHDPDEKIADDGIRISDSLPKASRSCLKKHITAQIRLVNSGAKFGLVLEDDCIMLPRFKEIVDELTTRQMRNLPPRWLIFLGGADNRIDPRAFKFEGYELIEKQLSTAEAYFIDRESCLLRLKWIAENIIHEPADHLLAGLDSHLGIRHYRTALPVATQGSITGEFKSTLDANRQKHGKLYLRVRYWVRRLSRYMMRYYLPRVVWLISRGKKVE